jgi:hypothetical protein
MAKETEVTKVVMEDGRTVEFPGKRKMLKEIVFQDSNEEMTPGVRFDWINGVTRTFWVPKRHVIYSAGHGYAQKLGDYVAGAKDDQGAPVDVDDQILLIEELDDRLQKGDWRQVGEGTGVGGASIIILAMVEATKKTVGEVKVFLQDKLDAAAAKGEKLTRQGLYQSLRASSRLKPIILRMEVEKASKQKHLVDGDSVLDEAMGA